MRGVWRTLVLRSRTKNAQLNKKNIPKKAAAKSVQGFKAPESKDEVYAKDNHVGKHLGPMNNSLI